MSPLVVRPAAPSDREDVFEISATVWDGHDYLPGVWDFWLQESEDEGFLLVGELDDKVVAVQHTAIQPMGVAWMEGIRVHPDFRQRGFAAELLRRALEIAPDHGCIRARLSTADLNEASAKIALNNEFHLVGEYAIYEAPPMENARAEPKGSSQVSDDDVAAARAVSGISEPMIIHQWSAYDLPGQKSASDFRYGLRSERDASVDGVGLADVSRDGDWLNLVLLEGSEESMAALAVEFRRLAASEGLDGVSAMLRQGKDLQGALVGAGYEEDERMSVVVFEKDL